MDRGWNNPTHETAKRIRLESYICMTLYDEASVAVGLSSWFAVQASNARDAEKASDQVRRCMTELGLTPSSRSRVKAVTVPKLDEKAAKYFGDPLGVRRR